MGWKMTTEEAAPPVAAGEYEATAVHIQDMTGPHGQMVRIEFEIRGHEHWDGRRVSGIASKKLSADTKLGRWVAAILGAMPAVGQEVLEDDVLHKPCIISVQQDSNENDRVFANVVDVGIAA